MKYGLALAGGGTRGAAHVGVLRALSEENLLPSSIAGASAGSIVAGLYASGMSVEAMEGQVSYLSKNGLFFLDPDYKNIFKLLPQILLGQNISLTGFLKGDKLVTYLCELTKERTIAQACVKIVIPTVDINTGYTIAYTNYTPTHRVEKVIWENGVRLCDAMMASSSVPAVFRPRIIGNYCLVDGGVTNNLPVDLLIAAGEKNVLAVDIGVDYEMPHDDSIIEISSHSFTIMSSCLKDCMSSGELLLLKPPLRKGTGLLTFEFMCDCMEEGYQYTKKIMPRIKKTLEGIHEK